MRDDSHILLVQDYFPSYRAPFVQSIKRQAARRGLAVATAASRGYGLADKRRDRAKDFAPDFVLPSCHLRLGSKSVSYRQLHEVLLNSKPDFVVLEQAVRNLDAWRLLANRNTGSPRVGLWGQGRSYSTQANTLEQGAKRWLTNRADWFFAYTQTGATYVALHGFPQDRISILWNSIDTKGLQQEIDNLTDTEIDQFRITHGLKRGRVGLFLGGVDERKGIEFLLQAAERIGYILDDFVLLVGGAGAQTDLVQALDRQGGHVRYLGRLDGKDKALALAVADLALIPEWVGLVAVDALATGTPLITTRHPSHSPEFEYLTDGETAIITEHDVNSYANGVIDLLLDDARRFRMSEACTAAGRFFSIEQMAQNFVDGLVLWRDSVPKRKAR